MIENLKYEHLIELLNELLEELLFKKKKIKVLIYLSIFIFKVKLSMF